MPSTFPNNRVKGTKCWRRREVVKNHKGKTIYQGFIRDSANEVSITTLMPKLHSLGIRKDNREVSGKGYKEVRNAVRDATKYMKENDC